jgi:hypothetical protein
MYYFYTYDNVVFNCNVLLTTVCMNILKHSAYASCFTEEEFSEFLMKTSLSQQFCSLSR